ncbi:MAG: hypothetical protein WC506_01040 [Candidatus Micrarchaeia archaeon]
MDSRELFSSVLEVRKTGSKLLVVISSFKDCDLVIRHLGYLSKQSFTGFNALFVVGVPFDDARLKAHLLSANYPFGSIIAKENDRRGCSGAFFAGQKYALENGYDYVVMADDDCFPVDPKLVEELYANRQSKYVAPTTVFVEDGYRKKGFQAGPTQYSLYSVEVFKRFGLYYLPLFQGADDGEYMERVKIAPLHIKNNTEHPYIAGKRLFRLFDRSWLFMMQAAIILKEPKGTLYTIVQMCCYLAISLFFLPDYGRKLFVMLNRLLLSYSYGKAAFGKIATGYEKWFFEKPSIAAKPETIDDSDPAYIDRGALAKLAASLGYSIGKFRRDLVVVNTYSFMKVFFLAVFARTAYFRVEEGKYLLVADNRNAIVHAAKLAAFPFFLVAYTLAFLAIFVPVKMLKQPKTLGYGLD